MRADAIKGQDMRRAQAERLLQRAVGDADARFREGQWEAVDTLVNGRGRVLVVERTGWGKSMVYFLATRILRDRGRGPALVISPLLALMRNQVAAARRIGLEAATINSTNKGDWGTLELDVISGRVDMVWISPERLANRAFMENVLQWVADRISLVVIDEAHCISDWGHDFRPDYRRIVRVLRQMPPGTPVLGTTATANDRVIADIKSQLGDLRIQRGGLMRDSLELQALVLPDQASRLAWLAERIPETSGTGIVYVLTKRDADTVADWLRSRGVDGRAYYSGVTHESFEDSDQYRLHLEELLLHNRIKVLVATTALGMGYDKPDVAFVFHYQAPGSIVAYYQQVGRAGRALDRAAGVLLPGAEDADIIKFFRKSAFPPESVVVQLLKLLESSSGMSVPAIAKAMNVGYGQITKALKFLSVERPSPIIKDGSKWHRTAARYRLDRARIVRLTRQRESEWREIQAYIVTEDCRMVFLQHALSDSDVHDCGRCDSCLGRPVLNPKVRHRTVLDAHRFLRSTEIAIRPRARIAYGASPCGFSGNLPVPLRASEGRVLSRWGDAGWGGAVRYGRHAGRYGDKLVEAAAAMIQRWKPEPAPRWITFVPSARQPALVRSFAERLARRLRLPLRAVLAAAGRKEPQDAQQNSFFQCKNLDGAFVVRGRCLHTPVLLVDDTVGSRWTYTIAAALLRQAGSGEVFPVALASTAGAG